MIYRKNDVNIETFLNGSSEQNGSRAPITIITPPTFTTPDAERTTKDVINERKRNKRKNDKLILNS